MPGMDLDKDGARSESKYGSTLWLWVWVWVWVWAVATQARACGQSRLARRPTRDQSGRPEDGALTIGGRSASSVAPVGGVASQAVCFALAGSALVKSAPAAHALRSPGTLPCFVRPRSDCFAALLSTATTPRRAPPWRRCFWGVVGAHGAPPSYSTNLVRVLW